MERWVAIDFETANERRDSACALGLAVIEDGVVANAGAWLIRPPDDRYSPWNTRVHGLTAEDTLGASDFGELWPQVLPYLEGSRLLAHNAPFDMSVLAALLDAYGLDSPRFEYACTVKLARKAFPHLHAHKLDVVCDYCEIPLRHHDASSDAIACAEVALRCRDAVGALTIAEALESVGLGLGTLRVR